MKLLFCGTPEFALPTLRRLHRDGHELVAVITQPDRPRGRGLKPGPPPVKVAATELGLRVEQPEKLRGGPGRELLDRFRPEAVIIVGYGEIIPADLLGPEGSGPHYGWINLHASLLPKYRGAAPVQWALICGEKTTGVTTIRLDEGLDTGPILLQADEPIREDDTALTLGERLAERGAALMAETLRRLAAGDLIPRPQDHSQATKAPLLKKEHGRLDWSLTAVELYNRIRGLLPWPGAYTGFRGKPLHLWWGKPVETFTPSSSRAEPRGGAEGPPGAVPAFTPSPPEGPAPGMLLVEKPALYVACGRGTWLRLEELQPADRKRLRATDFINGLHVRSGERFESAI